MYFNYDNMPIDYRHLVVKVLEKTKEYMDYMRNYSTRRYATFDPEDKYHVSYIDFGRDMLISMDLMMWDFGNVEITCPLVFDPLVVYFNKIRDVKDTMLVSEYYRAKAILNRAESYKRHVKDIVDILEKLKVKNLRLESAKNSAQMHVEVMYKGHAAIIHVWKNRNGVHLSLPIITGYSKEDIYYILENVIIFIDKALELAKKMDKIYLILGLHRYFSQD